jgi:hypothetical protein
MYAAEISPEWISEAIFLLAFPANDIIKLFDRDLDKNHLFLFRRQSAKP